MAATTSFPASPLWKALGAGAGLPHDTTPILLPDADPFVGTVLGGRYRVESYLQGGGMGAVYRARHLLLGHPLAIKVLRAVSGPAARERFLLEARAACSVGHPNIVQIVDFGVLPDRRPYLVMEYLQGQSLEQLIQRARRAVADQVSPLRACRIGAQIALGMQAVHDKGILHRDLKPGNVFVLDADGGDFVKILDFGIAKLMPTELPTILDLELDRERQAPPRLTQEGAVLGTPQYMAPEQAAGEEPDARADQYALGCILYEMLTGAPPFDSMVNPVATLLRRLTQPLVPPRARRPDLPISATLEDIVLRALARERELRFPGMRALAQALKEEAGRIEAARNATTVLPAPRSSLTPLPVALDAPLSPAAAEAPWARRLRALAGAGALVVLALLSLRATPAPLAPPPLPASAPPGSAPLPEPAGVCAASAPALAPRPLRIQWTSQNAVPIAVACTGMAPATVPPKGTYRLSVPADRSGGCTLSARGYDEQRLSYQALYRQARGGSLALPLLLRPL